MAGSLEHFIRKWDKDGDGKLSQREFNKLAERIGFGGMSSDLMSLVDADGSGYVTARELVKILRTAPKGSGFFAQYVAAAGAPGRAMSVVSAIPSAPAAAIETMDELAAVAPGLLQELINVLASNGKQVLDLFRSWGLNKQQLVTVVELGRALAALQVDVPSTVVHRLLAEIDRDVSGDTTVAELNQFILKIIDRGEFSQSFSRSLAYAWPVPIPDPRASLCHKLPTTLTKRLLPPAFNHGVHVQSRQSSRHYAMLFVHHQLP